MPLLERAACGVTYGGIGTTQKALACGVPVCAVPFGRDQLEIAAASSSREQAPDCTPSVSPQAAAGEGSRSSDVAIWRKRDNES